MKENTKFLWMYVGILFSFALILIVFAGFSQSNDTEETRGMQNDITSLSQKNTELSNTIKELETHNKSLQTQIDNLLMEKQSLEAQNENLKSISETKRLSEEIIMDALEMYNSGKRSSAREEIKKLNPEHLTQAQLYLYNIIASK